MSVWTLVRLTEAVIDLCKRLDELEARIDGLQRNVVGHERTLGEIGAFQAVEGDVADAEILDYVPAKRRDAEFRP